MKSRIIKTEEEIQGEVRNEVANLNSFVQERVTGMNVLQLFAREKIEYKKFKEINERHKKAWLKTVWYNSIFFPVAEIFSSLTLGLVVWYGGMNTILDNTASIGELTAFIMMIPMLLRPLNQLQISLILYLWEWLQQRESLRYWIQIHKFLIKD